MDNSKQLLKNFNAGLALHAFGNACFTADQPGKEYTVGIKAHPHINKYIQASTGGSNPETLERVTF